MKAKNWPTALLLTAILLLTILLVAILSSDLGLRDKSKWAMLDLLFLGATGAGLYLRLFAYRWKGEDEEETFIIHEDQ